jgi:hypothetical protein
VPSASLAVVASGRDEIQVDQGRGGRHGLEEAVREGEDTEERGSEGALQRRREMERGQRGEREREGTRPSRALAAQPHAHNYTQARTGTYRHTRTHRARVVARRRRRRVAGPRHGRPERLPQPALAPVRPAHSGRHVHPGVSAAHARRRAAGARRAGERVRHERGGEARNESAVGRERRWGRGGAGGEDVELAREGGGGGAEPGLRAGRVELPHAVVPAPEVRAAREPARVPRQHGDGRGPRRQAGNEVGGGRGGGQRPGCQRKLRRRVGAAGPGPPVHQQRGQRLLGRAGLAAGVEVECGGSGGGGCSGEQLVELEEDVDPARRQALHVRREHEGVRAVPAASRHHPAAL